MRNLALVGFWLAEISTFHTVAHKNVENGREIIALPCHSCL